MRYSNIVLAALAGLGAAQRPADVSICDFYTTALLKENNATNQQTLLTLVVNTAVIGNYTQPNVGIAVPGILANGTFNGTRVNLLPYFDGSLQSTNRGNRAVSVNFLDDGGAAPLMQNKPSDGNTTSNQYLLLTHLYQFFGVLAGCSMIGQTGYPAYGGSTDMYSVHKFMALNSTQMGYFITQVGLAAASFGVAEPDVTALGTALNTVFNVRCAQPMAVVPNATAQSQSICITDDCPIAPNATCANVQAPVQPSSAPNRTVPGFPSATATGAGAATSTGAAAALLVSAGSALGFAAAFAAALVI